MRRKEKGLQIERELAWLASNKNKEDKVLPSLDYGRDSTDSKLLQFAHSC